MAHKKLYYNTIIGLDPSLTGFGLVVLDCKGNLVDKAELNSVNKGCKRLMEIEGWIQNYIDIYRPIFMCKEAYAYGRAQRACAMGELGWAVLRVIYINDLPHCEIAPQTLKKFITGKGRGDKTKNIVVREVFRKWDFVADTDNEADAFGLAKLGYSVYKKFFKDTDVCKYDYERDCIKSVLTSKKKGIVYGQAQETTIKRKAKKRQGRNI